MAVPMLVARRSSTGGGGQLADGDCCIVGNDSVDGRDGGSVGCAGGHVDGWGDGDDDGGIALTLSRSTGCWCLRGNSTRR
jgi:hypothetical protein